MFCVLAMVLNSHYKIMFSEAIPIDLLSPKFSINPFVISLLSFFLMVQMDLVEIANLSKVVYLVHTSNAKNPFLLYFPRSFHKMVFVYVPGERFALLPGHSFFFHEHVCSVAMETGPCQFN